MPCALGELSLCLLVRLVCWCCRWAVGNIRNGDGRMIGMNLGCGGWKVGGDGGAAQSFPAIPTFWMFLTTPNRP